MSIRHFCLFCFVLLFSARCASNGEGLGYDPEATLSILEASANPDASVKPDASVEAGVTPGEVALESVASVEATKELAPSVEPTSEKAQDAGGAPGSEPKRELVPEKSQPKESAPERPKEVAPERPKPACPWGKKGTRKLSQVLCYLDSQVKSSIRNHPFLLDGEEIVLIGLKTEKRVELWKKHKGKHVYIRSYRFTGYSGVLGPKLREGDLQIPEGLYVISYMNPNSSFHLSMKVNYPNAFDRAKGKLDRRTRLGGDIFIHGKTVTVGCIPIGDSAIEELFYIIGKNGYKNTRVILAPWDFRTKGNFPSISTVTWENELYRKVKQALLPFQPAPGILP